MKEKKLSPQEICENLLEEIKIIKNKLLEQEKEIKILKEKESINYNNLYEEINKLKNENIKKVI